MIVFTIANSEDLIFYTISFHLQGSSLFPGTFFMFNSTEHKISTAHPSTNCFKTHPYVELPIDGASLSQPIDH